MACFIAMIGLFTLLNKDNRDREAKDREEVRQQRTFDGNLAPDQVPSGDTAEDARIAQQERERQAAEQRARQELARQEATHGPRPQESPWDGITPEANNYLKATLRDYDSMQLVDCYKVVPWDKGNVHAWAQLVKYRARNGFGGMNLIIQVFIIRDGRVIDQVNSDG